MVIRYAARHLFALQSHFFNHDNPMKWMVSAGPDHVQIAAANGVIDYFDALPDNLATCLRKQHPE